MSWITKTSFRRSGNSVTTSFPRRYLVPWLSSTRFKLSKNPLSAMCPASRKQVFSFRLPSVSRKTPPSKFQIVFGMRFGLSPGFCPSSANANGGPHSSNAAISIARGIWDQRVRISSSRTESLPAWIVYVCREPRCQLMSHLGQGRRCMRTTGNACVCHLLSEENT